MINKTKKHSIFCKIKKTLKGGVGPKKNKKKITIKKAKAAAKLSKRRMAAAAAAATQSSSISNDIDMESTPSDLAMDIKDSLSPSPFARDIYEPLEVEISSINNFDFEIPNNDKFIDFGELSEDQKKEAFTKNINPDISEELLQRYLTFCNVVYDATPEIYHINEKLFSNACYFFNDHGIIETIQNTLSHVRNINMLHRIKIDIINGDNNTKYNYLVLNNSDTTTYFYSTLQPSLYYNTQIIPAGNSFTVHIHVYENTMHLSHENILYIYRSRDETGNIYINVEHFEPYGVLHANYNIQNIINDGVVRLLEKLFVNEIKAGLQLNYISPQQIYKLVVDANGSNNYFDIINTKPILQGLIDPSSAWAGTCSIFANWFAFLRLIFPNVSCIQIIQIINSYLLNGEPEIKIQYLVFAFVNLIKFYIDENGKIVYGNNKLLSRIIVTHAENDEGFDIIKKETSPDTPIPNYIATIPVNHYNNYNYYDDRHLDCIRNLEPRNQHEHRAINNLCNVINHRKRKFSQIEKKGYVDLIPLISKENGVIEEIYNVLRDITGICIFPTITISLIPDENGILQSNIVVVQHVDTPDEIQTPLNLKTYYNDWFSHCIKRSSGIPIQIHIPNQMYHANMLIFNYNPVDRIMYVEHFEPHGFIVEKDISIRINSTVERLVYDLLSVGFSNGTIVYISPKQLIKQSIQLGLNKEINTKYIGANLQSMISDISEWYTTSNIFSMWYAFERLMHPGEHFSLAIIKMTSDMHITFGSIVKELAILFSDLIEYVPYSDGTVHYGSSVRQLQFENVDSSSAEVTYNHRRILKLVGSVPQYNENGEYIRHILVPKENTEL